MRHTSFPIALSAAVCLAALACTEAVSQSRQDRGARDQVCVYEHAGYGGWERCYGVGESVPDLRNLRNRISSVRIHGRAEIALYEHPDFQGQQVYVDSDVPDFSRWSRRWNDQVDSLRVSSAGFPGGRDRGQHRADRVCVYQHVHYQGNSVCWDSGEAIDDLKHIGWNDGISSVRTFGGTRVAFYEHGGFQGERLIVEGDIEDLTRVNVGGHSSWNDRISSVRIGGGPWTRRPGRR